MRYKWSVNGSAIENSTCTKYVTEFLNKIVLRSDMGLQFFSKSLFLFIFGISVMIPRFCSTESKLFSRAYIILSVTNSFISDQKNL
jgi:hypothetical protein